MPCPASRALYRIANSACCAHVGCCRRIDCLALSYLEVLQAPSLAELGVASMAAAVKAQTWPIELLEQHSEPQCRRLGALFMVTALQPLLVANGGTEALLAGASRLLVRYRRWGAGNPTPPLCNTILPMQSN
jgi:hypothetical protein